MAAKKFDVVIVGGGTAGITVAAQLRHKKKSLAIAIIDPATKHYYQPLWTLVGGGAATFKETERNEADLIPKGVTWIKDAVTGFQPDANMVATRSSGAIAYNYLVVCPGIQIDWDKIAGLPETLGKNGVTSNYSPATVEKTWEFLQNFKGGTALFTHPNTPIKCGGAPQKIMYLVEHYLRKHNLREKSQVKFLSADKAIFRVAKYAKSLSQIVQDRGIETHFRHNLEQVDGPAKKAYFRNLDSGELLEMTFDFLHVSPPMSSPDFIKQSPLANADGWVEVDKATTQHVRYPNVFSLGDASSLPTSKTGAAIRKQAPVLVDQLLAQIDHRTSTVSYDGYTSCPLVTGYGRLVLAEFDYDGKPVETFPFDQSKERLSMYLLKKHGLPLLYWFRMLKGLA